MLELQILKSEPARAISPSWDEAHQLSRNDRPHPEDDLSDVYGGKVDPKYLAINERKRPFVQSPDIYSCAEAVPFSCPHRRFDITPDRFFWIVAAITRIAFLRQSVAIQAASVMPAYRAWKTGEHLLKTIAIKTRAGGRSRGWYLARGNLLARYALLVSFATKSH